MNQGRIIPPIPHGACISAKFILKPDSYMKYTSNISSSTMQYISVAVNY